MVPCAYCERPLICDACRAEYTPPTPEAYESLSEPEVALFCPGCEKLLVCHWCKTPYDGAPAGDEDEASASEVPTG